MLLSPTCALCERRGEVVCALCAKRLALAPSLGLPLGVDAFTALLDYADARRVITSLKNGSRRDLVGWLSTQLVARMEAPAGSVVTWAPTSAARRRARGYDQAELLARALARRWGLRCAGLLQRQPGPAQLGRSARERRANPSFTATRACPREVVLVDDVATTGATLTAAARALRSAGSARVVAVVAARAAGHRAA